jgi:hypothetical protein
LFTEVLAETAPFSFPLLWCTQSILPHLLHVPFQFLVYYYYFFFFCRAGVSLSRGLCWLIPGTAVGIPHAAYLVTCWSASHKQVWSQCLAA